MSERLANLYQMKSTPKDYSGAFIYTNNILESVNIAGGRILVNGNSISYEHHITDHLGNVRVSFTDTDGDNTNNDTNTDNSESQGMGLSVDKKEGDDQNGGGDGKESIKLTPEPLDGFNVPISVSYPIGNYNHDLGYAISYTEAYNNEFPSFWLSTRFYFFSDDQEMVDQATGAPLGRIQGSNNRIFT